MSQPNQSRCVVVVEPMTKTMEGVETATKENSKKKVSKEVEEKTNGTEKKDAAPEVVNNGKESKKESSSSKENGTAAHVNGKGAKKDKKNEKANQSAAVETPAAPVKNGVSDVVLNTAVVNPTEKADVVAEPIPEVLVVEETPSQTTEPDNDELFPELNYDDTSDNECNFDSSSPEFSPVGVGRSVTRRSQAKKIPTPETPQQANLSATPDVDEAVRSSNTPERSIPLREKVFKMKDMYSPLRLSPAPESARRTRGSESPSVESEDGTESKNGSASVSESAKMETNFSKSRIKVSPYRRSTRLSEQYSTMANYSGDNTTQQTELIGDISSSSRDASPTTVDGDNSNDSMQPERSFTDSYRHITSRRSYKHLRELSLRNLSAQRKKLINDTKKDDSINSANATIDPQSTYDSMTTESSSSSKWTPVGHVIGRKRRQDDEQEESVISHLPAHVSSPALILGSEESKPQPPSKRMRLLGYMATPLGYVASPLKHLRDKVASSTPILHRPSVKHWQPEDPLVAPSSSGDVTVAEEAVESPQVADIVPPPGGRQEGHKWCSIM